MSLCIVPGCTKAAFTQVSAHLCREHAAAPPSRRGGWLGQHRKALAMAEADTALDANQVWTRLWVGSEPPFDRPLQAFTMLVLCAREIQPPKLAFAGKVVRPAFRDDHLEKPEVLRALVGSKKVAGELAAGGRVLVTCAAGLNRSALVAALAMVRLTRMSGDEVITQIRQKRSSNALFNPHFQTLIQRAAQIRNRPVRTSR